MSQLFKKAGDGDDDNDFDAGFKIPKFKDDNDTLKKALWDAHEQQQEEEDKEDKKAGKPKKKKVQKNVICCCGNPMCRIGGFVETTKTTEE